MDYMWFEEMGLIGKPTMKKVPHAPTKAKQNHRVTIMLS